MNKTELVKTVADKAQISLNEACKAVDAMTETIVKALKKGETAVITGFGTFKVSERAARTARNPKTGEKIKLPKRKSVGFKVGKAVKETLN